MLQLMRTVLTVLASVLGAVGLITHSGAAEPTPVPLTWRFKEGDKFYVDSMDKLKQTTRGIGAAVTVGVERSQVTGFQVSKVYENNATLMMKIEAVRVANPSGKPVPKELKWEELLAGHTCTFTLNGLRDVAQLDGYDDMLKKAAKGNAAVLTYLRAMRSEDRAKDWLRGIFAFSPEKAVSKGESWKRKTFIPQWTVGMGDAKAISTFLGTYRIDRAFSYAGTSPQGERVAFKDTIEFEPSKELKGKATFKVIDSKGTLVVDVKNGRLVRFERHGEDELTDNFFGFTNHARTQRHLTYRVSSVMPKLPR